MNLVDDTKEKYDATEKQLADLKDKEIELAEQKQELEEKINEGAEDVEESNKDNGNYSLGKALE